jgi:hypothetical protein
MERTQMRYFSIYVSCELPLSQGAKEGLSRTKYPSASFSLSAVEGKIFSQ